MTPDELRTRLNDATPEFREALARILAQTAQDGAQPFLTAIELDGWEGNGFDFVLALACLTDAQRVDAWYAACDRVATEDGGVAMFVQVDAALTNPDADLDDQAAQFIAGRSWVLDTAPPRLAE